MSLELRYSVYECVCGIFSSLLKCCFRSLHLLRKYGRISNTHIHTWILYISENEFSRLFLMLQVYVHFLSIHLSIFVNCCCVQQFFLSFFNYYAITFFVDFFYFGAVCISSTIVLYRIESYRFDIKLLLLFFPSSSLRTFHFTTSFSHVSQYLLSGRILLLFFFLFSFIHNRHF